MSRLRRLALFPLALAIPLALAACDGDGTGENEDEITDAIERSATSQDPAVCTELQTQRFTEETTGETGKAAIEDCRRDQREDPIARSVEVSEIEVDGGSATAVVGFEDGFIAGQSLEIALVEEEGQWKLDELTRFVDFDREQFIDTLVEAITEEAQGDPGLEGCVRQALEGISDEQLQATFLEDDQTVFEESIGPCFEGQQG